MPPRLAERLQEAITGQALWGCIGQGLPRA